MEKTGRWERPAFLRERGLPGWKSGAEGVWESASGNVGKPFWQDQSRGYPRFCLAFTCIDA